MCGARNLCIMLLVNIFLCHMLKQANNFFNNFCHLKLPHVTYQTEIDKILEANACTWNCDLEVIVG
jgi:hypothetical protein